MYITETTFEVRAFHKKGNLSLLITNTPLTFASNLQIPPTYWRHLYIKTNLNFVLSTVIKRVGTPGLGY